MITKKTYLLELKKKKKIKYKNVHTYRTSITNYKFVVKYFFQICNALIFQ